MADEYGDEVPAEEEAGYGAEEAPAEEAGGYGDAPAAEEEEAAADGGYGDAPAEDAYAAEPEAKEEPAAAEPTYAAAASEPVSYGDAPQDYDPAGAWDAISQDKGNPINWYAVDLSKKLDLTFLKAGSGGLAEIREFLAESGARVLFCLLRVNPGDSMGSSRAKFVFIRFVGSGVSPLHRAKVGTVGSRTDEMFPVKHLTLELADDEHLEKQASMAQLTKEFLRVGGAHKPEFYDYGPGQTYNP